MIAAMNRDAPNGDELVSDRRALIFDMDGLMVDSEPLWWRVERGFANEQGGAWSDALALGCVGKGLPNVIATMNETFGWTLDVRTGHIQNSRPIAEGLAIYTADSPLALPCQEQFEQQSHFTASKASSMSSLLAAQGPIFTRSASHAGGPVQAAANAFNSCFQLSCP